MKEVDQYLDKLAAGQRTELQHIRRLVKQTVPEAQEAVSYGMPSFKYKDKALIYYAAFKNHISIFPTAGPIEELKDKLAGFTVTKGTIHSTPENPLPDSLIKQILLARIANINLR